MNMNPDTVQIPPQDLEIDLDQIIIDISKYYIKLIEDLQKSVDIMSSDNKKELRRLLQDRENFAQIRRLLSFVKYVKVDADKIIDFKNQIAEIYGTRHSQSEELNRMIFDIVMGMKLPTLNLDIASYLLNKGNYDLLSLQIKGVATYDDITPQIYEEMNKIIHKKLLISHLPPDGLTFDVKEGILKAEDKSLTYNFELTLYFNQEHKEYDWFLLSFEHKLEKLTKIDKKIKRIQDEIVKLYKEGRREEESYIISFVAHKIKYYYTRKKAKFVVRNVELLHDQLEMLGSGETFEIKQKRVAKEIIYFEICYWKDSMLHALNPSHKFNLLIIQLINYSIFSFIELFKNKDPTLFNGLSKNDTLHLHHEPSLPSPESILSLFHYLNTYSQNQDTMLTTYKKVNQILLLGVSKQVKLTGLSLDNNFLEIFEEVKIIFQIYQLLCYYSALWKDIDKKDMQNITLCCRKGKDMYQEESLLRQTNLFMSVAIEENSLFLYVNLEDGKIDFHIEPYNKTVEVHKSRLKSLFHKSPSKFNEAVVFYKKILLLSVFNNFLSKENAKFQSQTGAQEDNFKIVIYKSSSLHFLNIDNTVAQVQVTFFNKIVFDDDAKNMTITTQVAFVVSNNLNKQIPSLKKELTMSLTPFDLKIITKKFEFFQKQLKYKGYYDFARRNNEEHILQTDFEKPISQINASLEQSFNIVENSIVITIRPPYPISENFITYINSHEGMKLLFNNTPNKPKTFEIYEKNKLIIKYATVLDSYAQLKKDIQRLEGFVHSYALERNKIDNKENFAREYHSSCFYNLSDRISLIFVNDKAVDILPHKYQNFLYYHDQGKDDKELKYNKRALAKELRNGIFILDMAIDINQRKNEYFVKKEKSYQLQQNGSNKDGKRMENMIYAYAHQYQVDVITIDPWHFVVSWRSIFFEPLFNFTFNLQILAENELECFNIICEPLNSLEKQIIDEGHKIRPHFKKFFTSIASQTQSKAMGSNAEQHQNSKSEDNSASLKLKLSQKEDFIVFVSEMTQYLVQLSLHFAKLKAATASASSTASTSH